MREQNIIVQRVKKRLAKAGGRRRWLKEREKKFNGSDTEHRKEEIELRSRIVSKTVTPTHTKDWYIKWVSSIILIVGMVFTANNLFRGTFLCSV